MIKEFQREYRWLSNFASVVVTLDGIDYPTVEHAYMSAKSNDVAWKHLCCDFSISPGNIKKLSKKVTLVEDWETKKLLVMEDLLRQKFNTPQYKELLLKTGNQNIQEGNRWKDKFWGIDLNTGVGENHLGRLIMKIRDELQ